MASGPIKLSTLGFTLVFIFFTEYAAWLALRYWDIQPILLIGLVRIVQIIGILLGIYYFQRKLTVIGLSLNRWRRDLINGILWSVGFGVIVIIGMGMIYLTGHNPLAMVHSPLPSDLSQLLLFFLIGAFISPIAEEICFRGVLYSYFRRWGVIPAILVSTILFTFLHSFQGFPVIQLVGAVLFAISFELSQSLLAPIVIHILGNLAIFTLSLPCISG